MNVLVRWRENERQEHTAGGGVRAGVTSSNMTDEVNTIKSLVSSKVWLQSNLSLAWDAVRRSGWKNDRPKNNNAYVPTDREHLANIITHGVSPLASSPPSSPTL